MNLRTFLLVVLLQPEPVVPTVSVQPDKIDLGETATLTLAVEGPAPLRIDMPNEAEKLLSLKSALMWQIKPLGPPRRTPQDGGRERWEQTFRVSPYFHGDRVLLAINSLTVNGSQVTFEAQNIRVRKTIEDVKAENAVPVTGIEQLPPEAVPPADASCWPFIALLGGVFAITVVVVLVRKSRAASPPIPPNDWAELELDRVERDHSLKRIDSRVATERLAEIVREFVERRFGLSATRLTTSELQLSCETAEWPADRTARLRNILEACDRAKFAGVLPDDAGTLSLIGAVRAWIEDVKPETVS
jgi:hypothetical protein